MCEFRTIQAAVQYARKWGGWIAECEGGSVLWFDAAVFNMTAILKRIPGNARIGVWPLFDQDHECHAILKGESCDSDTQANNPKHLAQRTVQ